MPKIMKKDWIRTLSGLTLISVLGASALAGCSSNDDKNTNAGASANTAENNFNQEGMPIVKEPVTLTALTIRWGNMGDTFKKNAFLQQLEKDSNIKIDWQVISSGDWADQKSVMLASGKLPDIIIGDTTFSDADIVNNLSLFRPLDDLIKQYMPNLQAALAETPEMKQLITFPDGKIYSLPARAPSRPKSAEQPTINKVWLDKLGLKTPETIDELYEVLKAFKEKDPNGNGKADEIPYSGSKDVAMSMLTPFGVVDYRGNNMQVTDGKPEYYPILDKYKEGIKWVHKLYAEGLIDQEIFTQDNTMLSAKQQNPDVPLIGFDYQWTPDAVFGQWGNQYIAFAPISGPDGKKHQNGDDKGMSLRRNELLISSTSKFPEVIARWADQFYTPEATLQNYWGSLGTVVQKNDDGTYSLMDPPEGTSADAWYWDGSLRDLSPKYVSPEFEKEKLKLGTTSGDGLKLELDKLGRDYVPEPYPDVMFTAEEYMELPTLTADINSYIKSTRAKWITQGGIDEEWDDYLKKLNDMGLEKLIKIYNDAYDRFKSGQ